MHSLVEVDGTLFIAGGFQEVAGLDVVLWLHPGVGWRSLDRLDGGTDSEGGGRHRLERGRAHWWGLGQAGGGAAASLALWGGGNSMPETSLSRRLKLYPNPVTDSSRWKWTLRTTWTGSAGCLGQARGAGTGPGFRHLPERGAGTRQYVLHAKPCPPFHRGGCRAGNRIL
ncbi:MAG: hypothetical protein R2810_03505 [Flavobacteriales bacterium]